MTPEIKEHIGKTGGSPDGIYNHKEAFCLMMYSCPNEHRSFIWNSRDGVTPFGIQCPMVGCELEASHMNWGRDTFRPDLFPYSGLLVFIDFPKCLAEPLARRRVESTKGTELYPESEQEREDLIERLTTSFKEDTAAYLVRIP